MGKGSLSEVLWEEYRVSCQFPDYWSVLEESLWRERRELRGYSGRSRQLKQRAIRKDVSVRASKQLTDPYSGVWRVIEQVDGPPAWFREHELGRALDAGPSIEQTLATLPQTNKRNRRIHEAMQDPARAEEMLWLMRQTPFVLRDKKRKKRR